MKTIVINTSKEAKNTKLDILFKTPFDEGSLLWIDNRLSTLGETVQIIRKNLLEEVDTVDKDYQLIVLLDLYQLPMGNDKKAVEVYRLLLERYICHILAEPLYKECNLIPQGICIFFVDSAREIRGLDVNALDDNIKVQEAQAAEAMTKREKQVKRAISGSDLSDEIPVEKKPAPRRTEQERILMDLFGWTEMTKSNEFSWTLRISATDDVYLDFAEVFLDTSVSIAKSHRSAKVLEIALQGVLAPREEWQLSCIDRFPIYTPVCFVSRENEQSKLEGFFCVFVNIFTCVQEKTLFSQATALDKDQIQKILVSALKKYKHFSAEENITVDFEPITRVFEQRNAIFEERKKTARSQTAFKDKTDEDVAQMVMSLHEPVNYTPKNGKLKGLDRSFYQLAAEIFGNYDTDVIRAQNNWIVKNCLEGLWSWRDKQTRESFRSIVDSKVAGTKMAASANDNPEASREAIEFLQEEYETSRDALIDQVTDAEKKLAGNSNILLETKDLMIKYGDWMRKGMWSWVSLIGAVFTVIATVFPFFYTDWSIGNTGVAFHVNLFAIVGLCAFLYAVASGIYIGYINRRKLELISKLGKLRDKSEQERKTSIIALYRYYTETIVEAESLGLLWREIRRRDRENAKKGMKRNYHIKRLKSLAEQVERFITMLKLDVSGSVTVEAEDRAEYARRGLKIDGEESYYQQENRRVYCLLPEEGKLLSEKGDTKKE